MQICSTRTLGIGRALAHGDLGLGEPRLNLQLFRPTILALEVRPQGIEVKDKGDGALSVVQWASQRWVLSTIPWTRDSSVGQAVAYTWAQETVAGSCTAARAAIGSRMEHVPPPNGKSMVEDRRHIPARKIKHNASLYQSVDSLTLTTKISKCHGFEPHTRLDKRKSVRFLFSVSERAHQHQADAVHEFAVGH